METSPNASVTLYAMGHHLGGKATSYRDEEGFNIDHGFHAMSTGYLEYTVVTDDGLQITGMMLDEATDSITFADTEGKEYLIERTEIDEIVCNARSHMPEGLEAKMTLQQMADLLAFMTAATPGSPSQ